MRPQFTTTTNSDHDQPILLNPALDIVPDGPDQLWPIGACGHAPVSREVADINYVTIIGGFAYP